MSDLSTIRQQTLSVYQEHAKGWDKHRPKVLFERNWLDQMIELMPQKAAVLDVGCGAGDPIAMYLVQKGLDITGIDACASMLDIARRKLPDANWLKMDMRKLSLNRRFDGIVSWDGFFHLSQQEQRDALILFSDHLKQTATLLLTIGDRESEVIGTVEGERVYHASLDPEEYKKILWDLGFKEIQICLNDEKCDFHSILLATRK